MIGAIAGDIVGSVHEGQETKTKEFPLFDEYSRFTNDPVLTVAVASCLLRGMEYVEAFHEYFHAYPQAGFGESFIRGAQATAVAILLARMGYQKQDMRDDLERRFGYRLTDQMESIRADYGFDVSCQGSVPQSSIAFLESEDYEDAVRNAISLGGDADTMACIAGGIAETFYGGVPDSIQERALAMLDAPLREVVEEFRERFENRRLAR